MVKVLWSGCRLGFWYLRHIQTTFTKKNFFKSCILPPPKSNLLFALYLVNPKKKFFLCWKKILFSAEMNCIWWEDSKKVWHLGSRSQEPAPSHTPHHKPHPPPAQILKYDSRPQVLYLFGILSPNAIHFCRKKIFFLHIGRIFFFWIY